MDFSKVKKLVIPEGEVQSITIADKVVWTKPQECSWHEIYSGDVKCRFSSYNLDFETLTTFDYSKSNKYRYTFTCNTRPQRADYGDNGTQHEYNKTSGTYEITNINSSPLTMRLLTGTNKDSESIIYLRDDNKIVLRTETYGNNTDWDGWTISLKVEQFY